MTTRFPAGAARILLAEDDPIQSAVICDLLGQQGYLVRATKTLQEAREAVATETPDLLLLDRMLPDGDGSLLCGELKALDPPRFPIILLTALDRVDQRVEGLLRGADDYIPKPFHPREFLARVMSCLRTLALQRELLQKAEELAKKHEELVATQAKLIRSERLAAIGEIGLAIRHEINNPLGSVLGFTDLLLAEVDAYPEGARRKLEAIRRATLRIRDVVKQLEDIQEDRTVEYVAGLQMTDLGGWRKASAGPEGVPPAPGGSAGA